MWLLQQKSCCGRGCGAPALHIFAAAIFDAERVALVSLSSGEAVWFQPSCWRMASACEAVGAGVIRSGALLILSGNLKKIVFLSSSLKNKLIFLRILSVASLQIFVVGITTI